MGRSQKIRVVESGIEKLGRMLSDKWDVRVVFEHNECKTDGRTIYLPVIPDDASDDLLHAMQGHLDHEAAHVIDTQFDAFTKLANQPKLHYIANGLEDPRIERCMSLRYRGCAINFKHSLEWCLQKVAADEGEGSPWSKLPKFNKVVYASTVLGQTGFDRNHWFFKDVVDADTMSYVDKVEHLVREALVARNSHEVVELAKKYMDILKEEEEARKEDDKNKDEDGEDGEGGEGGDEGGEYVLAASDAEVETGAELTDRTKMIKAATQMKSGTPGVYRVFTTEGDKIERISAGNPVAYKQFLQEANRHVFAMKQKLARSLLSINQARWETDKTRGKINPRSVFRVPLGTSVRVFREKVEAPSYDTAVEIMVDHSGSMAGAQLQLAAKTAIVLGEVLSLLNIPFSVCGFSASADWHASNKRLESVPPSERSVYTRWGNLWIGVYKDYDEPWRTAGHRLINMPQECRSNTYDGETLRYAAHRLLARKEKRKVLFWLNDGQPCPTSYDCVATHIQYAKDCAKEVEKLVEVVAFGINTEAVRDIYTNCVVVNNISDLPAACLTELQRILKVKTN